MGQKIKIAKLPEPGAYMLAAGHLNPNVDRRKTRDWLAGETFPATRYFIDHRREEERSRQVVIRAQGYIPSTYFLVRQDADGSWEYEVAECREAQNALAALFAEDAFRRDDSAEGFVRYLNASYAMPNAEAVLVKLLEQGAVTRTQVLRAVTQIEADDAAAAEDES